MIKGEWWLDEGSPLRSAVIAVVQEREAATQIPQGSSLQEPELSFEAVDDLYDLNPYGHTGNTALRVYVEAAYRVSQVVQASRKIAHLLHIF